ncbi:hydrocephalus-inducing protein homolog, partial [Strix uralensis]|uniref:hydrocephalus-inducing protein homolog n=1 Tax=Strix uralensis TaxID=36305 RepID=UPI003DA40B78
MYIRNAPIHRAPGAGESQMGDSRPYPLLIPPVPSAPRGTHVLASQPAYPRPGHGTFWLRSWEPDCRFETASAAPGLLTAHYAVAHLEDFHLGHCSGGWSPEQLRDDVLLCQRCSASKPGEQLTSVFAFWTSSLPGARSGNPRVPSLVSLCSFLVHPCLQRREVRLELLFHNQGIPVAQQELKLVIGVCCLLPSTAAELEGAVETQSLVGINKLMQLVEAEPVILGMEEVFDVLPLYGVLQPGESQRVMFTFFGHTNIVARVMALCRVEGGPTYEITLSGEASLISYLLDVTEIDCGLQLFNKVTEAEVTLQNSGKMGFTYVVLRPSAGTADSPLPGVPLVLPSTGYIGPGQEQVLKVYYLPGVPGAFCRTFQIQVGHLEPEEISLKGEGSFPRIYLDLPRNIKGNEKYEKVLKEVIEKMEDSQREEAVVLGEAVATEPPPDPLDAVLDPRLQMQMEQMLMEEHALEQQKALTSGPPEATAFDQHARRRLLKAELPEYLLDFGYVILGNTPTHVMRITNTGQFPVSFRADRRVLHDTGFSVDLDHVKHLLCCETKMFEVRFDPQSANLPLGEVDVLLPIKVAGGPTFHVRLHASVAMPSLCVSRDRLEFSTLQCGQCQEETVQLHNQQQV